MAERNKLWHIETVDAFENESSICLLARNEAEARAKLEKYERGEQIVSIDTCIMVSFAEVRGELGETYYYRTKKVVTE